MGSLKWEDICEPINIENVGVELSLYANKPPQLGHTVAFNVGRKTIGTAEVIGVSKVDSPRTEYYVRIKVSFV